MKPAPWTVERWMPDQQVVEGAAPDYLKHPWMSDGHLEWCCVNALIRREIVGYEETVSNMLPKPWTTGWVLQKLFAIWIPLLIKVGIAAGSLAWLRAEFASLEESPYRWWWVASVAAYYVWVLGRVLKWIRARRALRKT